MKKNIKKGMRPNATAHEEVLARSHAIALLERSISCGHDRLAVLRLALAARTGAAISRKSWLYCEKVSTSFTDETIKTMFAQAIEFSSRTDFFASKG